jgi:hypothetical protein
LVWATMTETLPTWQRTRSCHQSSLSQPLESSPEETAAPEADEVGQTPPHIERSLWSGPSMLLPHRRRRRPRGSTGCGQRGSVLVVWGGEGRNQPRTRRMGARSEWNDERAERAELSGRSSWGWRRRGFWGNEGTGDDSRENKDEGAPGQGHGLGPCAHPPLRLNRSRDMIFINSQVLVCCYGSYISHK